MNGSTSPLTTGAVRYVWGQLLKSIELDYAETTTLQIGAAGVEFLYCSLDKVLKSDEPQIVVIPCPKNAWQRLLTRSDNSLDWVSQERYVPKGVKWPFSDSVPVLFWGEGYEDVSKPFVERLENNTVIFYADILSSIFFMLSRWEETVVLTRDDHDRFPAMSSVAYKQRFLDRPVVDQYILILQAWLITLLPSWSPPPKQFSVKLSHDIDSVRSVTWRQAAGDILKRFSPAKAALTIHQIVRAEEDPHLRALYKLADLSERSGFRSAFYFSAADPGMYDTGYDPNAKVLQQCIEDLRRRGHEIGFHPGYHTLDDPHRFAEEKGRMDRALGETNYGGRQHYLRFRTPDTWRQWERTGLSYDSTLGYADHEGFRCGTCHPFHPFDVEQDRQLDLLEIPLIVMDGTLKDYRGLTPSLGAESILALAQRCQQVNGVFTLLWHNSSLHGKWAPWAVMYRRVLAHLGDMNS